MSEADSTLIEKSLAGDQQAFSQLYDRYAALIRAVCSKSARDYQAAQDMTQEVFLRAYDKLDHLKDAGKFASWLIGIAKFVVREHRRSLVRDRHVYVGLETPAEAVSEAEPTMNDIIAVGMERLNDKERLVLQIHYLQETADSEKFKILKVSRAGYYRLLNHARDKLANIVKKLETNP